MPSQTTRLMVGAQVLNAAELLGYVLTDEPCKERRSKLIANALKLLATTVDGADAYGPLMDTASDIDAQADRNIRAANERDEQEWSDQVRDEEQRDRFMEKAA